MRSLRLVLLSLICSPVGLASVLLLAQSVYAQTLTTLRSFSGSPDDGANPAAGLILDAEGNLYGTTTIGGQRCTQGCGTVFKSTPAGEESVLYDFYGGVSADPHSSLIFDATGNLYGTTAGGTVFRLKYQRNRKILYSFKQTADGLRPMSGLISDAQGNFYGTTQYGGTGRCDGALPGCGVVYEVTLTGVERVLYSFKGKFDGEYPQSVLVRDTRGNLYGTTEYGGAFGYGVVFKLTATGKFSVLHTFTSSPDGALPLPGLVTGADGNLYGTTIEGGTTGCLFGCGTVFQLTPSGKETVLYRFTGTPDGENPYASVAFDAQGNLYGTTAGGGANDQGTVFELTPSGSETTLYSFCAQTNCTDGAFPQAGVSLDAQGNLYGTTNLGGAKNDGTIFKVTP
jgi:uncharacterized repeat protein (TIGR03803 family)